MMRLTTLMCVLGAIGYAQADCYPGDTAYTSIVQQIYSGVTHDNIVLTFHGSAPMNRQTLCNILVNRHNNGKNSQAGQVQTNKDYHGYLPLTQSTCVNALTYTSGYSSQTGWQNWAGYHSGNWYGTTAQFSDGARWYSPYLKYSNRAADPGQTYAVQKVRFDSQPRIDNCVTPDMTGATCRYGWNQSGQGIQYVWGWDPKDNSCPSGSARGRRGAVVGFTFNQGSASCIVWVTTEEAFLECVRNGRRTSASSGPSAFEGYGQWTVS